MRENLTSVWLMVLVISCSAVVYAQSTAELGSISNSRFGTNWSLDGSPLTPTRHKLENTANFGQGGTVPFSINVTDTAATIDGALLAQFDLFFIGWLDDGDPDAFTPDELGAFSSWVEAGGAMIVTCDDVDHDAVCAHFGFPVDGGSLPPHEAVGPGLGHTIFHGPFGTVVVFDGTGLSGQFENATSGTVLAVDVSGVLPIVVERKIGLGRVVVIGDIDTVSDNTVSPGANIDPANSNDLFMANLFGYAAGAVMVDGFEFGDLSRWSSATP